MFIEDNKAALLDAQANAEQYMDRGVVVDSHEYLSVMLPIARNTIAIKFADSDPFIAKIETKYC